MEVPVHDLIALLLWVYADTARGVHGGPTHIMVREEQERKRPTVPSEDIARDLLSHISTKPGTRPLTQDPLGDTSASPSSDPRHQTQPGPSPDTPDPQTSRVSSISCSSGSWYGVPVQYRQAETPPHCLIGGHTAC